MSFLLKYLNGQVSDKCAKDQRFDSWENLEFFSKWLISD